MPLLAAWALVAATVLASGVAVWALLRARRVTARAQRADRRDRCLLAGSRELGQTTHQRDVNALVARVAHDLLGQDGALSVVWEEQGDAWVAIASAGPSRVDVIPSVHLPAHMLRRLEEGEPWVLDPQGATELQASYGFEPWFCEFVYAPLPRREGPRAVLSLACLQPPDDELVDALRRFVQEVAIAEDRAQLLAEVAEREARLHSVVQGSIDIIALLDDQGVFTFVNRASEAVHGYRPEELVGTNVFDLFHEDDRGRVLRATTTGDLEDGMQVSHRMYDANGEIREVETSVSRPVGTSAGYVLNVRDVTERRLLEAEIVHHAHHDALTGVANRRAFTARLDQALARFARSGVPVGLLMLDLDHFKPINDTHGHQAGDEVLVEVAKRLADGVRATDLVARMGGDEFAVILEDASDVAAVTALATRLEASVSSPIVLQRGVECRVTTSMGVARSWEGCDGDELLRESDQQLYVDKRAHHERVRPV